MALSTIWDAGARFLTLVRRVDQLFTLQSKVEESLHLIEQRLRAVEDRQIRMEAEGPQIITEARSAAGAAATAMSGAALNDVVTRLTRVEVKLEGMDGQGSAATTNQARISGAKRAARKTGDNSDA
jgi:hypothetical protein